MTALHLRVPPVAITAAFAGLMWLAAALVPALTFRVPGRVVLALTFALAGAAVSLAGVVAFRRASTTVNPIRTEGVSSLVTSGIYRVTRNPMYLGFLLFLLGWAVWLGHPLSFLFAPLFIVYMNRFQIAPEEQVLRDLFGGSFETYSASTRRWL